MRKVLLLAIGTLLLAGASGYRAFLNLFCTLTDYDDTGYMLCLIQGFNERGSLYRETFSQHGPFFSEFYWFVGRILHVPVTHDGIRWTVLVLWIGSSIAAGGLAYRLTQRVWIALLIQAVSFQMLQGLIGEPGHPISVAAVLLAIIVLVGASWRDSDQGHVHGILVGAFLGLLAMTKINLGLLFVLLAAGQFLGIYPASDAQVTIRGFFISLCLIPVLEGLLANAETTELFRLSRAITIALSLIVAAAPSLALAKVWWKDVRLHAYLYRTWPSLALPGAHLLRPDPANAALYRCLVENLRNSEPSFCMLPAVNSLYGWTGLPTPTGFNVGYNFGFLSSVEQQKIVEVARKCRPIALVLNKELMLFWSGGRLLPSGPLVDFAKTECRSAGSIRGYHLMSLNSEPLPSLTYCASLKGPIADGPIRITVTVPARIGKAATASLRNFDRPELPRKLLPLEAGPPVRSDLGAAGNTWEFTVSSPQSNLSADTLDRCAVQLWNDAGEWIADLPFARWPDGREEPLSGP